MNYIQVFDFSVNVLEALLWCQNDASRLQSLLKSKQAWYEANLAGYWNDFFVDVLNVDTANRFGLSVWARLLGMSLNLNTPPTNEQTPWGFGDVNENYEHGNFSSQLGSSSQVSDDLARVMIRLRYGKLTTRPSVVDINRLLARAFKGIGNAFVLDPLDMSIALFTFEFEPENQLLKAIIQYDLLPRPSAVGWGYRIVFDSPPWGFGELRGNFETSNFLERSNASLPVTPRSRSFGFGVYRAGFQRGNFYPPMRST